jgi:hypothetical protein
MGGRNGEDFQACARPEQAGKETSVVLGAFGMVGVPESEWGRIQDA